MDGYLLFLFLAVGILAYVAIAIILASGLRTCRETQKRDAWGVLMLHLIMNPIMMICVATTSGNWHVAFVLIFVATMVTAIFEAKRLGYFDRWGAISSR